jgi:uncharacterized OsmC-like protein
MSAPAMSADDLVINRVHSSTTETPGRAANEVRGNHFVIDEPTHLGGPGEQITPADAFLSGVAACGVLMVQGRARDTGVGLKRLEVDLEAVRQRSDTSVFQRIEMRFRFSGPTEAEARALVEHYQGH